MKTSNTTGPIFIIGSQRSGTTLLRLMLNAHSEIAIPEEGTFWMPLLREYRLSAHRKLDSKETQRITNHIKTNPQFKLWMLDAESLFEGFKKNNSMTAADLMSALYGHYAETHHKKYWGDKTPSFFRMIPTLSEFFPTARFIHIIRDGRDVYLSWRKLNPKRSNISVAALEWQYKVRTARKALTALGPNKSFEIRYEDLVTDPDKILQDICKYLSIEYEPAMTEYWQESKHFIGSHHSKLIFQPVTSASAEKWKRELTTQELEKFSTIAGPMLSGNGYAIPPSTSGKLTAYLGVIFEMAYGLPARAAQVFFMMVNAYLSIKLGLRLFHQKTGELPLSASDSAEKN